MIVDAQVHAYGADSDAYPWSGRSLTPEHPTMTGEQTIAAMDDVGVDAAVLVSTWVTYRDDTRYAESVYRQHPGRFGLVAPIDADSDRVRERVEEWAATSGAVGVRLLFRRRGSWDADHPGVVATLDGATRAGLAVNVHCWGRLAVMEQLARAFPDAQLVLDHLGLAQPLASPVPDDALAELDQVLALARHPNLAIKLTGACTYSRRPFPYDDLWEPIGRVIDAFGVERCLWGTDWQRATPLVSYDDAVRAFRDAWPMSAAEREAIMGANTMRIYDWAKLAP